MLKNNNNHLKCFWHLKYFDYHPCNSKKQSCIHFQFEDGSFQPRENTH